MHGKGMLEKAEEGIWPSFAPLGYRNVVGTNGKKAIDPGPDLAPIVSRLFEGYATGHHSLAEITRMASSRGRVREVVLHAIPARAARSRPSRP